MVEDAGLSEAARVEVGVRASLLELAVCDDCSEKLRHAVSLLCDCVQATHLVDPGAACQGSLPRAREALNAELARIEQRRDTLVGGLPSTLATRLTVLRERNVCPRICGISQGRCAACSAELPAVLADALEKGRDDFCPTCKRILVS